MEPQDLDDIPLLDKDEAIAVVRRWLDVEKVDPDGIFTQTGNQVVRYKDLIGCLEQDTPDGELLRFAISRGSHMRSERRQALQHLLHIAPSPAGDRGGQPTEPKQDGPTPAE